MTGIQGAVSLHPRSGGGFDRGEFDASALTRTSRVPAMRLSNEAQIVTMELIRDLMDASAGDGYDPFT